MSSLSPRPFYLRCLRGLRRFKNLERSLNGSDEGDCDGGADGVGADGGDGDDEADTVGRDKVGDGASEVDTVERDKVRVGVGERDGDDKAK